MNLIIDVGNTFVKLALFQDGSMVEKQEIQVTQLYSEVENIVKAKSPERAILSNVGVIHVETLDKLTNLLPVLVVNHSCRFPFKNLYQTPHTLGNDRLALATAAIMRFPQRNCLVIDAGSCITYDFVDSQSNYHGGGISPGLNMRYKALHTFTAKLPLLSPNVPKALIGTSTETSIHNGAFGGLVRELDGFIFDYKKKYSDLTVILTGGDAILLSKQLKNSIFANSNFLLEGLNSLLEFNTI